MPAICAAASGLRQDSARGNRHRERQGRSGQRSSHGSIHQHDAARQRDHHRSGHGAAGLRQRPRHHRGELLTVMFPRQVPVRLVAGSVGSVGSSSPQPAVRIAASNSTPWMASHKDSNSSLYAAVRAACKPMRAALRLRGSARRVGSTMSALEEGRMRSEIVREMLAEFLGTFVLIVFGVGVVAQTVLSAGSRRVAAVDQHRLGARRDDGLLRGRRRDRRAPQPGRHARARGASPFSVAQGRAVRGRADGRRVRRVGGGVRHLPRGARLPSTAACVR